MESQPTLPRPILAILDTGNFVLLDGYSSWESFKEPHDTILPGQILGTNDKLCLAIRYKLQRRTIPAQYAGRWQSCDVCCINTYANPSHLQPSWARGTLKANSKSR
ncbi:G-type lectin S-receptor-like serine/threonine-protein kinase LECRK2 [Camellia lanceoleosa]|uniref:G-type lectin S-receptor-like serine/threonine-protein kinase LECRK2 n=1 Tax=Camellia lanceoleosa TaxID=1840588 RepID=A0ACC0ILA3_9ERIC|nr:G-type lectin S-receptor-like serine/threonine-protein kinase LECRK2 [Camellia lanceoleosa]